MTLLWIPVMCRSWIDTRSWSETPSRLPYRPAVAVLGGVLVMGLTACASKDSILPRNLPSMQSIYEDHFEAMGADEVSGARVRLSQGDSQTGQVATRGREVQAGAADLEGFLRTTQEEIDNRFPQVPNPTLVMFVFPHLGPHGAPVPGYSTAFPLYESVEYALPGEVSP